MSKPIHLNITTEASERIEKGWLQIRKLFYLNLILFCHIMAFVVCEFWNMGEVHRWTTIKKQSRAEQNIMFWIAKRFENYWKPVEAPLGFCSNVGSRNWNWCMQVPDPNKTSDSSAPASLGRLTRGGTMCLRVALSEELQPSQSTGSVEKCRTYGCFRK